jgi:branched-subunit amino acid ABC-type transport system permease component
LRKRNKNTFELLVASLGLYICFQNLISLIWGDDTKSITSENVNIGYSLLGAYITKIQVIIIFVTIALSIGTIILINKTNFGRKCKAIYSNEQLANIFGIDTNLIIIWSVIIGSGTSSIVGILMAYDIGMNPAFGFNLLLYSIVAMIIGGVGKMKGLIAGSLLLATAQHLGAYYTDSKWLDTITYIILILFLIWKPLGFSGIRIKKIEL